MQVRDIMSTDVVTVSVEATLSEVASRLLDHGVGSTVVVDEAGTPMGIVTESDTLRAARDTGRPLDDIGVREVGHRPVITTTPSRAITSVARRMNEEGIKKVPVMTDLELVGMVTLTDIVSELSALRSEATHLDAARKLWDGSTR